MGNVDFNWLKLQTDDLLSRTEDLDNQVRVTCRKHYDNNLGIIDSIELMKDLHGIENIYQQFLPVDTVRRVMLKSLKEGLTDLRKKKITKKELKNLSTRVKSISDRLEKLKT